METLVVVLILNYGVIKFMHRSWLNYSKLTCFFFVLTNYLFPRYTVSETASIVQIDSLPHRLVYSLIYSLVCDLVYSLVYHFQGRLEVKRS